MARSRLLNLVYMLAGLGLVITSIIGPHSVTRVSDIVTPLFGVVILGLGGYGYLHPEKNNSSSAYLLGAVASLVFVALTTFSLIHFYGLTGFFSTGDSIRGVGFAALMLFVGVWSLLRYFSLRQKEGN
ncbi:MAG TPA: hypothetical protein VED37_19030 [Ktedonobacteraceae bacterium]|nr:hypothetical protein [Ktedonobacteraceae bacterium]